MFQNPWQFCVAIILIIWGTYYIAYRFWCRRKGIPVEILWLIGQKVCVKTLITLVNI